MNEHIIKLAHEAMEIHSENAPEYALAAHILRQNKEITKYREVIERLVAMLERSQNWNYDFGSEMAINSGHEVLK